MSTNDNAASALDLIRAVDRAIDLIITDFVCAVTVGADGVCAQATLREPGSFDGMPIILRTFAADRTTPWQERIGADQLSLFA